MLPQGFIMALAPQNIVRHCRHFSTTHRLWRKPNIQRPRIPGTERRILDAITVPIFPPDPRPLPVQCFDNLQEKQAKKSSELMDAYNAHRLREAVRMFTNHKMIIICHVLPTSSREFAVLRTKIITAGLKLVFVRNDLALEAVKNTKWCNLAPFLTSDTAYVVSETLKVPELVKVLRKTPELQLLGGLLEDRMMTRNMIMDLAKLPPLDTLRGELLTTLGSSAAKTRQLMGQHQQALSASLTELVSRSSEGHQAGDMGEVDREGNSVESVKKVDS